MSDVIGIKINVTKILKDRLFQGNGGAVYLDAVLIPSPDSKYGDSHFIAQSVTKEERERGVRGPIIGNAKILGGKKAAERKPADNAPERSDQAPMSDDQVPF